ncbi:hypothetical protein [Deinococcus aestuarii]|uniref:hypothetical protein n=1 Tax=Deinococcus aestuarii TaxID=2774531 RepID=UPI001C0D0202|nr:hypothetical protein [Deinococcus aestuarii]
MSRLLGIALASVVLGTAPAAPVPLPDLARLLALTRSPETAHLEVVGTHLDLGPGFVIDEWNLTQAGRVLINFSRLSSDAQAWQLDILRSSVTPAQLAPSKRALYTVTSPALGDVTDVSLILSGPFRNRFLEHTVFRDQSAILTVVDRRYLLASGRRWEALGYGVPEAETTYQYLQGRAQFCRRPQVRCRP